MGDMESDVVLRFPVMSEEDEDEGVAGHKQQTVNQAGMIERPDPRAEVDSEEDA